VQKSILIEDLSPLAMYVLHKANVLPDSDSAEDVGATGAAKQLDNAADADNEDSDARVLLSDDDIHVMMTDTHTASY